MKKEQGLDVTHRLGLGPIYARADIIRRKLAYSYCMGILQKIKGWEVLYSNAKYSFKRSAFYGRWIVEEDFGEEGKKVFFWKTIADEIINNSKEFYLGFPEKYHCYTEENFQKLCDWLETQRWSQWNTDILKNSEIENDLLDVLNADTK